MGSWRLNQLALMDGGLDGLTVQSAELQAVTCPKRDKQEADPS